MTPLLVSVFPGETTFILVATLLAIFAVIALLKTNARTAARQEAVANGLPFPTGAIGQIAPANRNPMFTRLFSCNADLGMDVALKQVSKGEDTAMTLGRPFSYAGPVVVQGSKYLWESKWSHLPSFEKGREGEEQVVNTLMNTLGDGWYIFRNFVLPIESEDIDIVIVGPAGVFAIEVKAYSGEVKIERGRCYRKTVQGHMYRQKRGPAGQVRHNAIRLNTFLKEHGIASRNYVTPMVVISSDSKVEVVSTRTDVCTIANLRSKLNDLSSETHLTPGQVRRIAEVLQAAASEQMRFSLSRVH